MKLKLAPTAIFQEKTVPNGTLSKKRREGEFNKLREEQVTLIERIVNDAFTGFLTRSILDGSQGV